MQYLTAKSELSCHIEQKIEKMTRSQHKNQEIVFLFKIGNNFKYDHTLGRMKCDFLPRSQKIETLTRGGTLII